MTDRPPKPRQTWTPGMGASVRPDGVTFSLWAPHCRQAWVELYDPMPRAIPMTRHDDGNWRRTLGGIGPGARYSFRLDDDGGLPDPYSRRQPDGVHGVSEVVHHEFDWTDQGWTGCAPERLVIYECHVGTATAAGTLDALTGELGRLADLGITAIELMPVAAFPGKRNWGYDGVHLYAVSENYGGPAQLKRFVDAAHRHRLAVILDVVYNHPGPDGNYLPRFSPHYFSATKSTPWGASLNFDGKYAAQVRRYVIDNACFWLNEYHIDGLRLDATSHVYDTSRPHILQELATSARASVPQHRRVVLIAETAENDVRYLGQPGHDGHGFDMLYADDFYWSLNRYATGEQTGRLQDCEGTLAEVARTINQGFLYEGQWSAYENGRRGSSAREQDAWRLQYCLQHHDHVGNRPLGDRLHHRVSLEWYRAASAMLLLLPYTPLLFMGQESAASSPFLFFTDHHEKLGEAVRRGRQQEFADCPEFACVPDPQLESTFARSRSPLDEATQSPGVEIRCLYRELLRLRREDAVLGRLQRNDMHASAPDADTLAIHWQYAADQRLLVVNFGATQTFDLSKALPHDSSLQWHTLLDTSASEFGGDGCCATVSDGSLTVQGDSAALLATSNTDT